MILVLVIMGNNRGKKEIGKEGKLMGD